MIVWPMLFVFLLGVAFGVWILNPLLRKWVLNEVTLENLTDEAKLRIIDEVKKDDEG